MKYVTTILAVSIVLALAGPARADWNEGGPHKMHYPQLPDPNGWDVAATETGAPPDKVIRYVGDDWKCSETGEIFGIHWWGSWKGDRKGTIDRFKISIYGDDPAGPGGFFDDNPYSVPAYKVPDGTGGWTSGVLWSLGAYLAQGEVTERF